MKGSEILASVDLTLLTPTAVWSQVQELCEQAIIYKTASICIPPCYIKKVQESYGKMLTICTVIGFPLGYDTTAAKQAAAKQAIKDGADEIDMVINITDAKNHDFASIENEIIALRKTCGKKILKVIAETCYLNEEEKIAICQAVTESGADYIKTSTGFGTAGAAHSDIRLFRRHIGKDVKIKAAGGIKTAEDMQLFLQEGCSRIGSSSATQILKDRLNEEITPA